MYWSGSEWGLRTCLRGVLSCRSVPHPASTEEQWRHLLQVKPPDGVVVQPLAGAEGVADAVGGQRRVELFRAREQAVLPAAGDEEQLEPGVGAVRVVEHGLEARREV